MAKTFSAQVDAWVAKSLRVMEAVVKTALQDLAEDTNKPRAQGGNLPVDTGFLRNSFSGAIGTMPSGPSQQGEPPGNANDVVLTIARARIGETIYLGWSANYAKFMEARYGFRESAAQRWPQFVASAVQQAKARIR